MVRPRLCLRQIATHFHSPTATDVAALFHLKTLDSGRLHDIVPLLFDAAEPDDEVAVAIVRRQADEIVALVSTTLRRLDMETTDTDVVLGGGILASNDRVLMEPLTSRLGRCWPRRPPFGCCATHRSSELRCSDSRQLWSARPDLRPGDPEQAMRDLREAIRLDRTEARSVGVGHDNHEEQQR